MSPIQNSFALDAIEEEICVSELRDSKGVFAKMTIMEPEEFILDYTTFHFTDHEGNIIGDSSFEESGKGMWQFDASRSELIFRLYDLDFIGGDQLEVYYTIEGVSKDGNRFVKSEPALVTIKGISCGATINKHIQTILNLY